MMSCDNEMVESMAILPKTSRPDIVKPASSTSVEISGASSPSQDPGKISMSAGGLSRISTSSKGSFEAMDGMYPTSAPGGKTSSSNSSSPSSGCLTGFGSGFLRPNASSCLAIHSGMWFGVNAKQARQPGVAPSFSIRPKVIYTRFDSL